MLEVSADDLNDCEDAAFGASVKRMPPWGALLLVSAVGVEVFLQLVGDKFLGSIGKERADSRDTPLGGGSERIETGDETPDLGAGLLPRSHGDCDAEARGVVDEQHEVLEAPDL